MKRRLNEIAQRLDELSIDLGSDELYALGEELIGWQEDYDRISETAFARQRDFDRDPRNQGYSAQQLERMLQEAYHRERGMSDHFHARAMPTYRPRDAIII